MSAHQVCDKHGNVEARVLTLETRAMEDRKRIGSLESKLWALIALGIGNLMSVISALALLLAKGAHP